MAFSLNTAILHLVNARKKYYIKYCENTFIFINVNFYIFHFKYALNLNLIMQLYN